MNDKNTISWILSIFTSITAVISTHEVLQIILGVLGILSALLSLSYNIYAWWKKATKDGKITPDEVKELKDIVDDAKDTIEKGDIEK